MNCDDMSNFHNPSDIHVNIHDEFYTVSDEVATVCEDLEFVSDHFFNVLALNVRSLKNTKKISKLETLLFSLLIKPTIIGVSETWVTPNSSGAYNNLDGYHFISNHRLNRTGGGVAFYIENGTKFTIDSELSVMNEGIIESLFIEITINKKRTYVWVIYRAPPSERCVEVEAAHTDFFFIFRLMLQKATRFRRQCILMGDLNHDILD